jgi:predicted alpha/beta hydrolase family esterase
MTKRVFLIHGWGGSPDSGWKPWLKKELEKMGFEVIVPFMPNTNFPKLGEWLPYLSGLVGKPSKDTFLVGHSLGCVTILKYLESLKSNQKVGGVILVAGFGSKLPIPVLGNFFVSGLDWVKVKSHSKRFVAINSSDDKYVPLKFGEELKEKLGAELIVMHKMGHFSDGDKCFELPIVLEKLLELFK